MLQNLKFTNDYAVVELQDGFVFQKDSFRSLAVSGPILKSLLIDGGKFYLYRYKIYYCSPDTNTYVILRAYLPNLKIDDTVITDGKIKEKYTFDCNDAFRLIGYMGSAYPTQYLDMASGKLLMSNDNNESLTCGLTISDARTVDLDLMQKDGKLREIKMSTIKLPTSVNTIIGSFFGDIDLFIKSRKVIIKQDNFYFVFGR